MATTREYRKVTLSLKLDVKRLQAVLARTMRTLSSDPATAAAPARLESVLIEPNRTTVFLSGNSPTLDAVAKALRSNYTGTKIAKTTRATARRMPKSASAS